MQGRRSGLNSRLCWGFSPESGCCVWCVHGHLAFGTEEDRQCYSVQLFCDMATSLFTANCCTGRVLPTSTSSVCFLVRSLLWFVKVIPIHFRQKVWPGTEGLSALESVFFYRLVWDLRLWYLFSLPHSCLLTSAAFAPILEAGVLTEFLGFRKLLFLTRAKASLYLPLALSCTTLLCTSLCQAHWHSSFLQKVKEASCCLWRQAFAWPVTSACNGFSYGHAQVNCYCFLNLSLCQHTITLVPAPGTSLIHLIGVLILH